MPAEGLDRVASWRGGSVRAVRLAFVLALLVAALVAGLSDHLAKGPLRLAGVGRPAPDALVLEAERRLDEGDSTGAKNFAERALIVRPQDVRALRVLALTASSAGDYARADALMDTAGRLSLRDRKSQVWLFERRIAQQRYDEAFRHADALVRAAEVNKGPIFATMITVAEDPSAQAALSRILASNPPWREAFLWEFGSQAVSDQAVEGVLLRLKSTHQPPNDRELTTYISRLISKREYAAAATAWRRLGSTAKADGSNYIHDGEFDGRSAPGLLGWTLMEGAGVSVVLEPFSAGQNALRVTYDGYGDAGIIRQMLVLPPGAYRFEGRAFVESGAEAARRLRWTIVCLDGGGALVARPVDESPSAWKAFAVDIVVPAEACSAQWLELEPDPGERRSDLVVWFDKLSIHAAAGERNADGERLDGSTSHE